MQSALDAFAQELARECGRLSKRPLRRLSRADAEDVLASAVLAAWEQHSSFDPKRGNVSAWFGGFLHNALRAKHKSGKGIRPIEDYRRQVAETDDTEKAAEMMQKMDSLDAQLTAADKEALVLLGKGFTIRVVSDRLKLPRSAVRRLFHRIRGLEISVSRWAHQSGATQPAIESDDAHAEQTEIDRELEKLSFPPRHGKECPPCILCAWWEGFRPTNATLVQMEVADLEVREAQVATYFRKTEISARARNETLPVKEEKDHES